MSRRRVVMPERPRRTGEPVEGFEPEALRRLRQGRGLTLDALGELAGASRASLIAYEKGYRRPGLDTLRSLASALECDWAVLAPAADPGGLTDWRMRAGLTKTELAARLGLPRNTWDQIERGGRPLPAELVADLARHLGIEKGAVTAALQRGRRLQRPATPRALGHRHPGEASLLSASAPGRLGQRFPSNRFVGRDEQLAELGGLLSSSRLLTLTGTAGVGKTRLAVELSRRTAAAHADGVWLVELAAIGDPELVPQGVATALGVREQRGRSLTETLCNRLQEARMLLLLDNCEHLAEACGALVGRLLDASPGTSCVATSQRPLGVAGERRWTVPPLILPRADASFDDIAGTESVRLFCERATASNGDFTLSARTAPAVAEICRRLEGIPLAIQLAAARVSILSPAEILQRLDNPLPLLTGDRGVERHRTLRNALDWSHSLLPPHERSLLRRLSVFVGGCGIDAVEQVCASWDGEETGVLDALAALATKSLLTAETSGDRARYRLLESVRHYAAERAAEAGETAELRRRHAEWCIGLAETAEVELTGPDQVGWIDRLEIEHDNLRAALSWAIGAGKTEAALRLAGALTLFWRVRGYFREGRAWLEAALGVPGPSRPEQLAKALRGKGFLAFMVQETALAIPALERALELSRRSGDTQGQARSLLLLGNAQSMNDPGGHMELFQESIARSRAADDRWCLGHALAMLARGHLHTFDLDAARPLLEECVRGARQAGELQSLRIGLYLLGTLERTCGEYPAAEALLSEGLAVTRRLGEPFDSAMALRSLGQLALARNDAAGARALLDEALILGRQTGDPSSICRALSGLGGVALVEGDLVSAQSHFETCEELASASGLPPDPGARRGLGELALARGDLSRASTLLHEATELARSQSNRAGVARSLTSLAQLSHRTGDNTTAVAHHREALRVRAELRDVAGIADSLHALAELAAAGSRWDEAARLLGAADALAERVGVERPRAGRDAGAGMRAAIEAALRPGAFAVAWRHGRAMSADEAVAYARGERGRRGPRGGWETLTRAERAVTDLAVQGLTNAQIAERLSVTVSTVEGHLSNVFGKLGLGSRAKLVREGVRREIAREA